MTSRAPLAAAAISSLLLAALPARAQATIHEHRFTLDAPAEVVAGVEAACAGCDWGVAGREARALRLELDGRYSQHLMLVRGPTVAPYHVSLGALGPGPHRLAIGEDAGWASPHAGRASVARVTIQAIPEGDPRHALFAHSPIVYARPNAVGRFTDVPLLTWVEQDRRPEGRRLRYSVIFSNEDGGTPAGRLLATWGRLTDIEYALGVELAADGRALSAEYQGKDHKIVPFGGRREGGHALLWDVTDNNMLAEEGATSVRFAPAPLAFDLSGTSREAVMDAEPWTYAVSSAEARREGRVKDGARPGEKEILDPRRYLYLEACAETRDVGLTFGVGVAGKGGVRFVDSDGGNGEFLIQRSPDHFPNGCFRAAVPLPQGARVEDLRALRFRARTRPPGEGETPLPPGSGSARLLRVNKLFVLGNDDQPGPSFFTWTGELALVPEGPAMELRIGG
ncbi:MAG: hypothetical protein AB7O37_15885 [Vicinamibacteria bacterium]